MKFRVLVLTVLFLPIALGILSSSARACSCARGTYVRYWPREELPANGRIVVTWMGEHPVFGAPPSDRSNIEAHLEALSKTLRLRAKGAKDVPLEALHLHVGQDAAQLYLRPKAAANASKLSHLVSGKTYRLEGFEDSPSWQVTENLAASPAWITAPAYDAEACIELYQRDGWSSCSRPQIPLRYELGATNSPPEDIGFLMLVRFQTAHGAVSWLQPHSYDATASHFGAQGCSRSPLRPPGSPVELAFTPIGASGQVGPTRSVIVGGDAQVVEQWSEREDVCRALKRSEVAQATRCVRDANTSAPQTHDQ